MKQIKLMITLMLLAFSYSQSKAQINDAVKTKNKEWQISARAGYDHPIFNEDFKYINYKGGIMAGISANHYWNKLGIQADFDYLVNTPVSDGLNGSKYFNYALTGTSVLKYSDVFTHKENVKRSFVGIGPAYRFMSKNKKIQTELALLGGIGFVNGGEVVVEGKRENGTIDLLTYHSGFNHLSLFTGKAQARVTYLISKHWGLNIGAYYIRHFDGAEESSYNTLLKTTTSGSSITNPIYYAESKAYSDQASENGVAGQYTAFGNVYTVRQYQNGNESMRNKLDLASVGAFAGITYRFTTRKKATPVKVVEQIIAPVIPTPTPPVITKYCIQVTARDRYTNEVLPNTDIALKSSNGTLIGTSKTNAYGTSQFCDLLPENYTIAGVLNDVALDVSTVNKAEFYNGQMLSKDVLYSDRNFIVIGKATECNTSNSISDINIMLEQKGSEYKNIIRSDYNGNFVMQLPENGVYALSGKKDNYFTQTKEVVAANFNREKSHFIQLEICAEKADCDKGLGLNNILFDVNKAIIKEESKKELDRLVKFMQDNPQVKIEIGSHTDCRSSAAYNKKLSQNRANASVNYVISQGISNDRIVGKGYGESKLLNGCADGVKCTEEQHSINRRTEMKVICPNNK